MISIHLTTHPYVCHTFIHAFIFACGSGLHLCVHQQMREHLHWRAGPWLRDQCTWTLHLQVCCLLVSGMHAQALAGIGSPQLDSVNRLCLVVGGMAATVFLLLSDEITMLMLYRQDLHPRDKADVQQLRQLLENLWIGQMFLKQFPAME